LITPPPIFELKAYQESGQIDQARDIFSLTPAVSPSGAVENTPKGQLPVHLKIVGILIAHPSQIVIEDSFANKTYFIDEGNPQAGIKIAKVGKDQMIINYQGQDIVVPISKK
jgi:type II secretory pathway component PulC